MSTQRDKRRWSFSWSILVVALSGCLAEFGEPIDEPSGEPAQIARSDSDSSVYPALDVGPSACTGKHETPLLRAELEQTGDSPGMTYSARTVGAPEADEEDGGLDPTRAFSAADQLRVGVPLRVLGNPLATPPPKVAYADVAILDLSAYWAFLFSDYDGDCLLNYYELNIGTDYLNPDTDGDGWFDGPCNERRKLVLERIKAHDEQEDSGDDEFYLIADDIRFPNADTDDWWDFDDGDSRSFNQTLASRTRGTATTSGLGYVYLEGWEDDYETWNEWTVDDLLGWSGIDLGAHADGEPFTVWWIDSGDDWRYELTLRVDVEQFADPNPLVDGDSDGDGIAESDEYRVARYLGGIADPARKDVLVEVDWMNGHSLHTNAKRLVATQYHRHGIHLYLWRHQSLPVDGCLTVPEARSLYQSYFNRKSYHAFRYAVVGEELWNDASGVAWADTFFMDDSTWWIDGDVLAQAGTLHHELGHTMSLRKSSAKDTGPGSYRGIDEVWHLTYHSAMNYTFQPTVVDYSGEGSGDTWDHDDWEDVDPTWGLRYSFGATTSTTVGHCGG